MGPPFPLFDGIWRLKVFYHNSLGDRMQGALLNSQPTDDPPGIGVLTLRDGSGRHGATEVFTA
jgi:hypothetical protein